MVDAWRQTAARAAPFCIMKPETSFVASSNSAPPNSRSNLSTADAASASPVSGWRSDLNWAALTSKLSPSASLIHTSYENYACECMPEFYEFPPSNHALIDQPSGMCLPHLFLGWEMSWPRPSENGHLNETCDQAFQDLITEESSADFESWLVDPTNPSLNLPSKVLFPAVASDVVAAVNFAKEHGLEISVKNSGHSYQGASSKKDTLLLNMNRYTRYARTGITDCDASVLDIEVAEDLNNQPCLLSLAKNKSSLIRVDKVFRAVIAANQEAANQEEGYKYHLVGGAAGTVSPMGWTWQGGLAGTTGGRLYGFGVDQVVQLEMVLPNGFHAKFGPTEWGDASAEGFTVPRTKVVPGINGAGRFVLKTLILISTTCGLHSQRGWGNVGSSNISTSAVHDYLLFVPYAFNLPPTATEECSAIDPQFAEFKAKYISAPSLLNVTKEHSLACSSPDLSFVLVCFGEEDVMQAWTNFLDLNNLTDHLGCLQKVGGEGEYEFAGIVHSSKNWAEQMMVVPSDRFPGKVPDQPLPSPMGLEFARVLVPQSWLDESEEKIKTVLENAAGGEPPYYAFGGATASGSDQANALSQAHRNAALMVALIVTADERQTFGASVPKHFGFGESVPQNV
eukprot:scaffold14274_cov215-Skeletonema_marinoi.AAC.19